MQNRSDGNTLREKLERDEFLIAVGTHDPLTAILIEEAGFDMVVVGGYSASASILGKPDIDLLGFDSMLARLQAVASVTNLPIYADGETGFGNVTNVMRTVEEYEKAGAACIQLEDQIMPKRCGHMAGKQVISRNEWLAKLKAALHARNEMLIVARTDAGEAISFEEAITRGKAAVDFGADIIFIEALRSEEQMEQVNREISVPTVVNMIEGGKTPLVPHIRLKELGFSIVIHPCIVTYCIARQVKDFLFELKRAGDSMPLIDQLMLFDEFNELVGLSKIRTLEDEIMGSS
ncbi:MAG: isocitrate lyase/PEP mutase family protein [Gemmatimonadota bacterium]|nr:MAG: isocitrate lyase/PEP mutase family protein [Gemmatimonadota bacterium]